jgi:hypothetical protein
MRDYGYHSDKTAGHFTNRGSDRIGMALAMHIHATLAPLGH